MRRPIFTDEHALFRDSVAEFCRRHVRPNIDRWREEGWTGREIWQEAGRQDFIGLAMPPEYGGAGIGMTKSKAGSDLAGLRTRAVRDGDGWIPNGAKTFITNGSNADLVVVAARTGEGRKDVTVFLLDGDAEGFSRGRRQEKAGSTRPTPPGSSSRT
ncbi:MAG TPA: acyl-CoA dehydrogenase family protein [Solirubrobacterales bacterium]|nr:acyl-CoA dehydrogenase family protein [Solirubrobacterales bacterium]